MSLILQCLDFNPPTTFVDLRTGWGFLSGNIYTSNTPNYYTLKSKYLPLRLLLLKQPPNQPDNSNLPTFRTAFQNIKSIHCDHFVRFPAILTDQIFIGSYVASLIRLSDPTLTYTITIATTIPLLIFDILPERSYPIITTTGQLLSHIPIGITTINLISITHIGFTRQGDTDIPQTNLKGSEVTLTISTSPTTQSKDTLIRIKQDCSSKHLKLSQVIDNTCLINKHAIPLQVILQDERERLAYRNSPIQDAVLQGNPDFDCEAYLNPKNITTLDKTIDITVSDNCQ